MIFGLGQLKRKIDSGQPVKRAEHFQAIDYVLMICFVLFRGFVFFLSCSLCVDSFSFCFLHTPLRAVMVGNLIQAARAIAFVSARAFVQCFIIGVAEMKWKTGLNRIQEVPTLLYFIQNTYSISCLVGEIRISILFTTQKHCFRMCNL